VTQDAKNTKDRAQSLLFDQNRVTVLIEAAFLLPLLGERKYQPERFFPYAIRAFAVTYFIPE
jgi:hypothetical protein